MATQRHGGTMLVSTAVMLCLACFGMGFACGSMFSSGKTPAPAMPAPSAPVQAAQPAQPAAAPQSGAGVLGQEIAKLRQAALASPGDARLWTRLGDACYDAGDADGAIEAYGRSLALEPSNADVRTDMGSMHRMRGEPAMAVRCYDDALGYAPAHKNAVFNKGITLLIDLEKAGEAVAFWKAIIAAQPGFTLSNGRELEKVIPELCAEAAGDLERKGRLGAALQACDEALKLEPRFLPALTRRAWLLEHMRSPEAQAAWRAVLAIAPEALDPAGQPAKGHIQ